MGKRDEDDTLEHYKKLNDEIIIEKVNEIFRSLPDNYIAALKEIGFKFHREEDDEEIEERTAKPNNKNQRKLVTYFEGGGRCIRHDICNLPHLLISTLSQSPFFLDPLL